MIYLFFASSFDGILSASILKSMCTNAQTPCIPIKSNRNLTQIDSIIFKSGIKETDTVVLLGCSYNQRADIWVDNHPIKGDVPLGCNCYWKEDADSIFEICVEEFRNPFLNTNTTTHCHELLTLNNITAKELFESSDDIITLKRHIESNMFNKDLICRVVEQFGNNSFNFKNVNKVIGIRNDEILSNLNFLLDSVEGEIRVRENITKLKITKKFVPEYTEFYFYENCDYSIRIIQKNKDNNCVEVVLNVNPFKKNIQGLNVMIPSNIKALSMFVSKDKAWIETIEDDVDELISELYDSLNEVKIPKKE
jgi:hypothetical protein